MAKTLKYKLSAKKTKESTSQKPPQQWGMEMAASCFSSGGIRALIRVGGTNSSKFKFAKFAPVKFGVKFMASVETLEKNFTFQHNKHTSKSTKGLPKQQQGFRMSQI